MQNILKKIKFLLLLIPLGIVISYIDRQVTKDAFLSTNEISDHYIFIGGLILIVISLLGAVLYYDKKSND
jgi:hypothetical protein